MRPFTCAACLTLAAWLGACDKPSAPLQTSTQNAAASPASGVTLDKNFELAANNEIVSFCLPIPKGEYMRDYTREQELPRASVALTHKTRGFVRSDAKVAIAEYFHNSYLEGEEPGKTIEEKKLFEAQGNFYAKGYWSNRIHEERFVEITWLRKTDTVRYTAHFAVSEWPAWQERLNVLLKHHSRCE
jgi:hypothetical protein